MALAATLPRAILLIMLALAIGAALFIAAGTLGHAYQSYLNLLVGDQWFEPDAQAIMRHWFAQHNEHRLIVPRLFFLIDFEFFAGSDKFNRAMTFAVATAQVLAFAYAAHWSGLRSLQAKLWVATTATAVMFAINQFENFDTGFQVQFLLIFFFANASLISLARYADTRASPWLAASLLLVLSGVGTMANGLMLPVLWTVAALLMRVSGRLVIAGAALGCAAIVLYLIGYQTPPDHADPLAALRELPRVATYVLAYLGGPVGRSVLPYAPPGTPAFDMRLWLAMAAGALLLGATAACAVAVLLRRARPMQVAMLFVAVFVVGTAVLTALGRIAPSIEPAFASRYGAAFAALVPALAVLLMSLWPSFSGRPWIGIVAGAATTAALVILAALQREQLLLDGLRTDTWREAQTALLAEVKDTAALGSIQPDPDYVWRTAPLLRGERLSFAGEPWAHWLGERLPAEIKIADRGACQGDMLAVRAVAASPAGSAVSGWIASATRAQYGDRLVIIDADRRVVGYARLHLRAWIPPDDPYSTDRRWIWRGHVQARDTTREVAVVLLSRDLSAGCTLIEGLRLVPQ